jgi:periplasmic protein CpxP/Spy
MKLKNLSLIFGSMALALTAAGSSVNAQTVTHKPLVIAQNPKPAPANQQKPQSQGIQLSKPQRDKIEEIRTNARQQIEKIFTEQQRRQVKAGLEAGQSPQQVFSSVKFTPDQQKKIREVMQSSQAQIEAQLTPTQKQQLEQIRKQMVQRSLQQQR